MNLKNYIVTISNILPKEEYEELIYYCKTTDDFIRSSVKSDIESTAHQNGSRCSVNLSHTHNRIRDLLCKSFFEALDKSKNVYGYLLPDNYYTKVSGYSLLKYEKDDYLSKHSDFDAESGSLTMSYNINDDYVGGELAFWGDYIIPTEKNSMHVFPSCFLYPHEIKPVIEGNRYSAITWFGYEKMNMQIDINN
jgi:hypothetical protein